MFLPHINPLKSYKLLNCHILAAKIFTKGQRLSQGRRVDIRDFQLFQNFKDLNLLGIGGGSVGWAVTSDTRDLQFESQYWQNLIYQLYI